MFARFTCLTIVIVAAALTALMPRQARASEPSRASVNAVAMMTAVEAAPSRWNTKEPLTWGDLTFGGRGRAPILLELDGSSGPVWRAIAARPVRGGGMLAFELHWTGTRSSATAGR